MHTVDIGLRSPTSTCSHSFASLGGVSIYMIRIINLLKSIFTFPCVTSCKCIILSNYGVNFYAALSGLNKKKLKLNHNIKFSHDQWKHSRTGSRMYIQNSANTFYDFLYDIIKDSMLFLLRPQRGQR